MSPSATNTDANYGLISLWPATKDIIGGDMPCRLEGEIADLVVFGKIPTEINGTFYRMMCDPYLPPHPNNVPIDSDGSVQAFRIHDRRADMKMRYVETERLKLERQANKALFGLYRNPFTHHRCVRGAVDSTANTNLVFWANKLLALKEGALHYANIKAKTFKAHPKADPYTDELVVFGYQANGLATDDIVVYSLDRDGDKREEQWIKSPWSAMIHDSAITKNFLILVLWPFEANIERMKKGKHHWAWSGKLPATFIVVPRRRDGPLPPGWSPGEYRTYKWKQCLAVHSAGAWEEEDGTICIETSRQMKLLTWLLIALAERDTRANFVRWTLDLTQPTGTTIQGPRFPRIDERILTSAYDICWINVFLPEGSDGGKNFFYGLNGIAMHSHKTSETKYFYAGDNCVVQEPVFVPRSKESAEGDGWVLAVIERRGLNRNDLVIIDTTKFEVPVAIVQLPFHVKAQIHGNWVNSDERSDLISLDRTLKVDAKISGMGALEPIL
ncbi:isoeugenol monooxygenase [Leptodontidium sp. MPI-SDFR-AT-0119]|nr:isoeugenol monooxygenase [Leptodontidium sp. MPI-SDFR-AT-0119]